MFNPLYSAVTPLTHHRSAVEQNLTHLDSVDPHAHLCYLRIALPHPRPQATILMKNTDPTEAMKASPDMSIMICKLTPEPDPEFIDAKFKGRPVPEAARAFYDNNHISTFTYSRPFRKGDKTGNESEVRVCAP